MKTKLTLSIDKRAADRAKRYARKRGKSLSELLERYMNTLDPEKKPTIVDSMVGIIRLPEGVEPEEIIKKAILKKHLK